MGARKAEEESARGREPLDDKALKPILLHQAPVVSAPQLADLHRFPSGPSVWERGHAKGDKPAVPTTNDEALVEFNLLDLPIPSPQAGAKLATFAILGSVAHVKDAVRSLTDKMAQHGIEKLTGCDSIMQAVVKLLSYAPWSRPAAKEINQIIVESAQLAEHEIKEKLATILRFENSLHEHGVESYKRLLNDPKSFQQLVEELSTAIREVRDRALTFVVKEGTRKE